MAALTHTFAQKLEATHWGTAVYAAFVAGVTFLVLQMLIALLVQDYNPWLPIRMIAAIALGTDILADIGMSLGVLLAAFLVHFPLSVMTAWILAPLIEDTRPLKAVLIGAGLGVVIYLVNFYLLTAAFSWFGGLRGWATFVNHLIFGGVMAWTYQHRRQSARRLNTA